MAKVRAGKVVPKKYFGDDEEANTLLHAYKAKKKIAYLRASSDRWKLAAASGADRYLLIGKPQR